MSSDRYLIRGTLCGRLKKKKSTTAMRMKAHRAARTSRSTRQVPGRAISENQLSHANLQPCRTSVLTYVKKHQKMSATTAGSSRRR